MTLVRAPFSQRRNDVRTSLLPRSAGAVRSEAVPASKSMVPALRLTLHPYDYVGDRPHQELTAINVIPPIGLGPLASPPKLPDLSASSFATQKSPALLRAGLLVCRGSAIKPPGLNPGICRLRA